jgi:hypothetical protein
VRLIVFAAAVGTVLAIPGFAGAGDPRLLFDVQPSVVVVLENGGRRDALVTLDVRNPGDRRARVERLRLTYLEGDRAVATVDPATSIFTRAGLLSDPRIEPGASDRWEGLCLSPPTSATNGARFEFALVARRGVRMFHATQVLDVRLQKPVHPPVISLPVTGTWRVSQGHACDTNHRRGRLGGEFAWDLVAVNESGRSGSPGFDNSRRNDESATFGRPVLAPTAGSVVFVADGADDNDELKDFPRRSLIDAARAPRWIFGNHVVLDAGHGVFVLIAHLRKDSIVVKPGDKVHEGEELARAGNSGNTMLPHVHIQVMDRADPTDPGASGIPALFRDYVEVAASGDGPQRDAVVRKVAAGDPPQGAVVLTSDPGKKP